MEVDIEHEEAPPPRAPTPQLRTPLRALREDVAITPLLPDDEDIRFILRYCDHNGQEIVNIPLSTSEDELPIGAEALPALGRASEITVSDDDSDTESCNSFQTCLSIDATTSY